MQIRRAEDIKSSEITEEKHYLDRRKFLRGAVLIGSATATGFLYSSFNSPNTKATGSFSKSSEKNGRYVLPDGERATDYADVTNYNNFYEFSTDKQAVAHAARNFKTRPWTVTIGGHVDRPGAYDIDDLLRIAPPEDRVYRHRCVEAWSMVIPWLGFPLFKLLERVRPTSQARFVQFTTLLDPGQMPNQGTGILDWPYVEGLRMDEAMHPLTILAVGLYGKMLLPQNGAPLRLVVPWKYGFKGGKSIVRIDLTDRMPATTWNRANPREYGFYSNVNPDVDHPRWSQASERRIGEFGLRKTLMFNGYADEVAHLYKGMDLRVYF